jgi:nicotinate-nucleotide pyrophosphorylase (carboxylating)
LNPQALDALLKSALAEDAPQGDLTSLAVVPRLATASARLVARKDGVAAGLGVFGRCFTLADRRCRVKLKLKDGWRFRKGTLLAELKGPARALLLAERVALNYLQQLCGVATLTAAFVREARGTRSAIYDTRKTTPLMRPLQKYAVLCGGGKNHRMSLSDAVLIKDNHIRLCGGSPATAVRRARKAVPRRVIEVEVETLAELADAIAASPDIVLLDNMPPTLLKKALKLLNAASPRILSEVSGGVRLGDVRRLARLGVDRISVGALTHSAAALDLSLEFI